MRSKAMSGSYLLLLADLLERRGIDPDRWLAEAGLDRSTLEKPDHYLSPGEASTAVRLALHVTGDPALGLHLGQQLNLHAHGLLGVAGMLSRNVRDSLQIGFKYAATRSPLLDLALTETEREAIITITLDADMEPDTERFTLECLVYSFVTMANFLFSGDVPPASVEVTASEPAHSELYTVLYRAPLELRFDAEANRLRFPREVLDRPLPLANEQTRSLVEKEVSQEMDRLIGDEAPEAAFVARVEAIIGEEPDHYRGMEEVAHRLGITTRTLHRRIEKAGTSFKSLLENARFRDAARYLETTELSITQIGCLLDYNDSSNFARAFRRWSGMTPLQYRKARTWDKT